MRLFRRMLSVTLAVLMAAVITVMPAAQITAKAEADSGSVSGGDAPGKYISEVRVGMGKSKDAAAASLKGYYILKDDDGDYADLNKDAGSNSIIGSKGDKVVLLGFKTTNDPKDAITDLAVMNMDGGYSVKDYETLMDRYLDTQIKPMIEGFMAAITEYRENYNSTNPANKKRAQFAHDMLNLLYDDDTGAYLGDLLLSETSWEMGDEAYEALSDAEKKQHADLITIFMQANGKATLTIQNLLSRASDASDTTWAERFVSADTDALMAELFPDTAPSDAEAMMANIFGDDARKILAMWNDLQTELGKYDEALEFIDNYDMESLSEAVDVVEENSGEELTVKQEFETAAAALDVQAKTTELEYYLSLVAMHDYLENTPYFDEFTLLDYFSQSREDAASDMMTLYGLISSLSPGQRAGLDYISLRELILMAMTDADEYSADYSDAEPASIYEGVDREIYEKGGVALTNDALRKQADAMDSVDDYPLSALTTVMWCATGASMIATIGTWAKFGINNSQYKTAVDTYTTLYNKVPSEIRCEITRPKNHIFYHDKEGLMQEYVNVDDGTVTITEADIDNVIKAREELDTKNALASQTSFSKGLAIGFTVVTVALTALSVWMTYRDLCDYYDVEFSPIPNYIVDEADITTKNAKGETIVIKNQTAYYKAALCNRTEKDEKFGEIGNKADLNGDVGRKWVALYSVKNEAQNPILADSFKVVYGTSNVPLDYERGIHKFGSGAAFDMNNTYYAWNHGKGGIYVYYKLDDEVDSRANAVGTFQTGGMYAAVGGIGLLVGLLAGSLLVKRSNKKKEEETAA